MAQKSTIEALIRIILIVVFLPIVLVWYIWAKTDWTKRNKWIATIALAVVFLFVLISDSSDKSTSDSASSQKTKEQSQAIEVVSPKGEGTQQQSTQPELQNAELQTAEKAEDVFKVSHVVDGDTIKLENGKVVRYIGIDTPETVDPRKPIQCFGKEASNKNKEMVEGKEVRLVKDVSETDKYGRLLQYVYVGDVFVNDYLVQNGFAHSYSYPPDIKFQDQFRKSEEEARNNKRGLWADDACKTETSASTSSQSSSQPSNNTSNVTQSTGSYSCNCSKTCTQMNCAEAQYQLKSCGCSRRDADKDGVACDADCQ